MREFVVKPCEGVGPVKFGMTREQVYSSLGNPDWIQDNREEFLGGLFVSFDSRGQVEYITVWKNDQFTALFDDVCLYEVPAEEAVSLLLQHGKYDATRWDIGSQYIFPDLEMSLWRELPPKPDQSPDDPTGRFFETLGIGRRGCYSATNRK